MFLSLTFFFLFFAFYRLIMEKQSLSPRKNGGCQNSRSYEQIGSGGRQRTGSSPLKNDPMRYSCPRNELGSKVYTNPCWWLLYDIDQDYVKIKRRLVSNSLRCNRLMWPECCWAFGSTFQSWDWRRRREDGAPRSQESRLCGVAGTPALPPCIPLPATSDASSASVQRFPMHRSHREATVADRY